MSDARAQILDRIRSGLGRKAGDPTNPAIDRIQTHGKNLIPDRGKLPQDQQVALFIREAERVAATTAKIPHFDNVPTAVGDYLRRHNLPAEVKIAPTERLTALAWQAITVAGGRGEASDGVSVSLAFGGVAETGTLVMASSPESPNTLNFLPMDHIVVISAADIAGDYETVWDRFRERARRAGTEVMPRTVNLITGPSRTADIEQTLLLGAHGPQRLHIVIVDEPPT